MQKSGEIKQSRWRILVQWKLVSRRRTAPWKAGKHKMHIIQGNNGKKTPWCFYIEMTSPLQRWLVSQWHISVKICPNVHQIKKNNSETFLRSFLWNNGKKTHFHEILNYYALKVLSGTNINSGSKHCNYLKEGQLDQINPIFSNFYRHWIPSMGLCFFLTLA